MSYTTQHLSKDAEAEVRAIKVLATRDELLKLVLYFNLFDPTHRDHCFYGLMCGTCDNGRALELIYACCISVFQNPAGTWVVGNEQLSRNLLEGKEKILSRFDLKAENSGWLLYFSALEVYAVQWGANNQGIVDFLSGKTEKLDLSLPI